MNIVSRALRAVFLLGTLLGTWSAIAPAQASFLVTPWTAGRQIGVAHPVTCSDCSPVGSSSSQMSFISITTGVYSIKFRNTPTTPTQKNAFIVTPLGVTGVTCSPYGQHASGTDLYVQVSCKRGTTYVDTRFIIERLSSTTPWTGAGRAFATVTNGAIASSGSWASSGQTPTVTNNGAGRYFVIFPGMNDQSSGGNPQIVSTASDKRCIVDQWLTQSTRTWVSVLCYNESGALENSNFVVSFKQQQLNNPYSATGFLFMSNATPSGTYTPMAFYNRGAGGSGSVMTVNRTATGRYRVNLGTAAPLMTGVHAQVTAYGSGSICNLMDVDKFAADVSCTNLAGTAAQDSRFSLQFSLSNTSYDPNRFNQVNISGVNFERTFDAGQRLICGYVPTGAKQVMCMLPENVGGSINATVPVGGSVSPPSVPKSIAVSNVNGGSATVLVLGQDNVIYGSAGDLFDHSTLNAFSAWTSYGTPKTSTGTVLTFKKLIAARGTNSSGVAFSRLYGLTTAGKVYTATAAGQSWSAITISGSSADTFLDISHGRDDIFAWRNDNRIIRYDIGASTPTTLPTLPNGLLPIAVGGRFVMTNAGLTSGSYPCYSQQTVRGNYTCAGSDKRVYRLGVNNTWLPMLSSPMKAADEPTTNLPDVLTMGSPLASTNPTIVDAESFEGTWGSFLAFQYFTRMYIYSP